MTRSPCRLAAIATAFVLGVHNCPGVLQVGDEAPALDVGGWLQGEAVAAFAGDKVYLVEFWATWCGPCIASIPHVNALHERYADEGLVVVGQNVFEHDDSLVKPFVRKMVGKMKYRVATDNKAGGGRGRMAETWLAAAGRNGIPCAFVVDKTGRIAFIGHPMQLEQADIEALLAEPSPTATGGGGEAPAAPGDEALALKRRIEAAIRAGEWEQAEAGVAALQRMLPEQFREIGGLLQLDLLAARGRDADAVRFAEFLADDFNKAPDVLNAIAAVLVRQPSPGDPLLEAAEKLAAPISAAEGEYQAAALANLARIALLRGDANRAVEFQTRAVAAAAEGEAAAQRALLDAYTAGRPAPEGGASR